MITNSSLTVRLLGFLLDILWDYLVIEPVWMGELPGSKGCGVGDSLAQPEPDLDWDFESHGISFPSTSFAVAPDLP